MKYAVVTGTSKGLGESIAKLLMQASFHVIGIARNGNKELEDADLPGKYAHYYGDLSNLDQTLKVFDKVIEELIGKKDIESLHLVQNAALIQPIEQAGKQDPVHIEQHMNVNLVSPMVITNRWLDAWQKHSIPLVMVNITSGAADRSVYGWTAYCASKAGLNHFTRTVALEQEELNTGNKIFLFDPSIMDTEMQGEIRSSDPSQFIDVDNFRNYKTNDKLRSTDVVAKVLVDRLLDESTIENGEYFSVKDIFK